MYSREFQSPDLNFTRYPKPKKFEINGNRLVHRSTNFVALGKLAIVPFKIFIAVFAIFWTAPSWGLFAASAKAFTCSNASALSSCGKFVSDAIAACNCVNNSLIPGLSVGETLVTG